MITNPVAVFCVFLFFIVIALLIGVFEYYDQEDDEEY